MPSTVAFISVRALGAGPVVLLSPCPFFQEVWKAESTLNKECIDLLIASGLAFLVIFLEMRKYKISLGKCVLMPMKNLMQVNPPSLGEPVGMDLDASFYCIFWHRSKEKIQKGREPNRVDLLFHWWLDLPDSSILLLASLNCSMSLWILSFLDWNSSQSICVSSNRATWSEWHASG